MIESDNRSHSPLLITILDDEASVRNSLNRLLCSHGYSVAAFASADVFLNSDNLEGTRCLILDVRMPGLSGLDLQDILIKLDLSIPIIFITGYADENVRDQVMNKGAIGLLEKPFPEKDLLDLLQKHVPSPARTKTRP